MSKATKPVNNVNISNLMPLTTIVVKPLPDNSKIEVCACQNFCPWKEHVYTLLDMHGVVFALSTPKPNAVVDASQL